MVSSRQLILASNNQGKLREFNQLFAAAGLNIEVLPQSRFNIADADETGLSFAENAILKARHAARLSGLPAIADDSGLSVDILGGAPGIYSARYAGEHGNDAANNRKLLADLLPFRGVQPLTARFICLLALVRHAHDPLPLLAQGEWHGEILPAALGEHGFGYDPLFWLPDLQKSSAQLPPAQKNAISHRAQAMQHMLQQLLPDATGYSPVFQSLPATTAINS